jgi:hypothetical protein
MAAGRALLKKRPTVKSTLPAVVASCPELVLQCRERFLGIPTVIESKGIIIVEEKTAVVQSL